jgi:DNA-binding transcriptional MocR family regulator
MSIEVMTLVWKSDVQPVNARVVLLALADNANDRGRCWPGTAHLAGKAGLSRRTVFRMLAELEKQGVVLRRKRKRANGSRTANGYMIDLDVLRARPRQIDPDETSELDQMFDDKPAGQATVTDIFAAQPPMSA